MKKLVFTNLLILFCFGVFAQKGSSNARFANKIAGAYLAVAPEGTQLMQIFADGNLTFELSDQFPGNNNFHESFDDPVGQWKATGKHSLSVTSLDLILDENGIFIGVGVATNNVQFNEDFTVATVDCQGALYAAGTDPFAEGAQPVQGSEFSCTTMVFKRVPKP